MRRIEQRKRYIILALALALVLTIPFSVIKVISASGHITGADISSFTGEYGSIVDSEGTVLYDGSILNIPLYGNLISNGMNSNSVFVRYRSYLAPRGLNPISGYRSVEGKEGGQIKLTLLSEHAQQAIADAFAGNMGCCFCYNYKTGEIYTAISLPSGISGESENGALQNRCFDSTYIPGSAMKIVASVCAIEQDRKLIETDYYCDGVKELANGSEISCLSAHGNVDFTKALGYSCNGYFSTLSEYLDVEATAATLEKMGISVNEEGKWGQVDALDKKGSSTSFRSNVAFSDLWALVGQGESSVNVIDMARIAGAVVNGGEAAQPHIISEITDPGTGKKLYTMPKPEQDELIPEKTADLLAKEWSTAVDTYYSLPQSITHAKTGTAQRGDGTTNRTLIGVCEEADAAFMIVVERPDSTSPAPAQIATVLAGYLSASQE